MKYIINIAGKAGSGKTTIAEYIEEKYKAKHLSWAKNLKVMCMYVFELNEHQVFTQDGKIEKFNKPITVNLEHIHKIINWMKETIDFSFTENVPQNALDGVLGTKLETPRQVLQYVGTDICRKLYQNYHTDVVKKEANECEEQFIVISDTRFDNELDLPKQWNRKVINVKIKRSNNNIQAGTHISEQDLVDEKFDVIIQNDSTLEDLKNKIDNLMEGI